MEPTNGKPVVPEVWSMAVFGERCLLLNKERTLHPMVRAKAVKWWREAFALEAMASDMPRPIPGPVHIVVCPMDRYLYKQDVGACFPTAKAAIDGLVDAGFLPDDGTDYVKRLTFLEPMIGEEVSGLAIGISIWNGP